MKIGVFGLGSIGMRHAKNLIALGQEVHGRDTDPDKEWDLVAAGGKIIETAGGLHASVIAVPSEHHAHYIKYNNTGMPMLMEKPLATEPVDISNVVMVGNNLRFHGCVKQAKQWLAEDHIGKLRSAQFTLAQKNTKYKDHVILNWGSHELDLATYLLGDASVVSATGTDRVSFIQLQHRNGVRSNIHLDYVTEPHVRCFQILGDEGAICVNLEHRIAWVSRYFRRHEEFQGQDTWDDNYKEEMQAFIDRINGKKTLGATGAEGLEVLKLCLEAIRLSQS